jgi:subfamily B ATP-binding cassette protein HlyB/CyaB
MTQAPRDDLPHLPHKGLTVVGSPTEQEPPASPPPKIDTGLACLVMMARLHGVAADADQLAHEAAVAGCSLGTTDLLLAAKRLELQAKAVKVDVARLAKTPLPAVAVGHGEDGSVDFFILARVDGDQVLIQSPAVGRPETLTLAELQARWKGEVILFTSRASVAGELTKFDFTWFIPAIVKYRKLLLEVLLVSFVLQFFALITPLFFQVVMDKVLVHRGFTTLDVIAVGLTVVVLFEVSLTALRSFVFAHTTSRIDVELGGCFGIS